ncbi:hypothetical protein GOBAR_AA30466 [Gossypium barbadense]|uniref:Uncharacterized protein n=1 Tax=Gossypium barbadense TaxID=3634 RepID=A0A2P5WGN2_GOSBA|nr:hypothetical protein GOBAR_AA30466 [Gossypium barbadense]
MSQMQSQPTQLQQQLGLQKQPNQACRLILRIVIACKCSLDHVDDQVAVVPPTNAFFLMHCRSTPTKSWLEEANRVEEHEEEIMEAFQKVEPSLGSNIELKFDDNVVYQQHHLIHVLQLILQVFFLTNGGTEIYNDTRRNSLKQAINVSLEGGFQGIVSEIKGVFKNS